MYIPNTQYPQHMKRIYGIWYPDTMHVNIKLNNYNDYYYFYFVNFNVIKQFISGCIINDL
jgi:hypothetical protein